MVDVDVLFVSLLIFIYTPLETKPNKGSDFVLFMALPSLPAVECKHALWSYTATWVSQKCLYILTAVPLDTTGTLPLTATPLGAFKKDIYAHHMKINQLSENISKLLKCDI